MFYSLLWHSVLEAPQSPNRLNGWSLPQALSGPPRRGVPLGTYSTRNTPDLSPATSTLRYQLTNLSPSPAAWGTGDKHFPGFPDCSKQSLHSSPELSRGRPGEGVLLGTYFMLGSLPALFWQPNTLGLPSSHRRGIL
jgi:hypothetical protein